MSNLKKNVDGGGGGRVSVVVVVLRKTEAENVNKDKVTKEKELGEDVRQRALETFKETKERNEGEPKPKKTRNSGCDTVVFLREKMEVDNLLKAYLYHTTMKTLSRL